MSCTHEKSLRYAYTFARAGYGDIVTFTCEDCGEKVTEKFRSDSPYRNWTTTDYAQPWANAGGPRRPDIAEMMQKKTPPVGEVEE